MLEDELDAHLDYSQYATVRVITFAMSILAIQIKTSYGEGKI